MWKFTKPILLAGVTAGAMTIAAGAQAATIVVENFTGLKGGDSSYTNENFLYDPTKFTNGQCFDAVCLNEFNNNGDLTTVTEVSGAYEGGADEGAFELFGFYLNYNGSVASADFFTVSSDNGKSYSYNVATQIGSFADVTIFNEDGTLADATSFLTFGSGGYFFIYDDDIFANSTEIVFSGLAQGGTLRLDCVALSHKASADSFSNTSTAGFNNCDPVENPNPVPVPGSLPLLAGGLIAAGYVMRRRRTAA